MNTDTEDIIRNPDKNFSSDMIRADPLSSSRGLFKSNVYAVTVPHNPVTSAKSTGLSVANPIVSFGEDASSGPMFQCGCDLSTEKGGGDICGVCKAFLQLQEGIKHFAVIVNLESLLKDCNRGKKSTREFRTRVQVNMYVNTFSSKSRQAEEISDSDNEEEEDNGEWPTYIRNQGDFSNDELERPKKTLNAMYPPIGTDSIRGKRKRRSRKTIVTPKKQRSSVRRRLIKNTETDIEPVTQAPVDDTNSEPPKTPPNTPQRKRRPPAAPMKKKNKLSLS